MCGGGGGGEGGGGEAGEEKVRRYVFFFFFFPSMSHGGGAPLASPGFALGGAPPPQCPSLPRNLSSTHFAACARHLFLSQFPHFARPGRSSEGPLVQRRGSDIETSPERAGRRARPGRRKHTARREFDDVALAFSLLPMPLSSSLTRAPIFL